MAELEPSPYDRCDDGAIASDPERQRELCCTIFLGHTQRSHKEGGEGGEVVVF